MADHLGNLRVLFSDDGTGNAQILQSHSYYPFGMEIESLSEVIGANENQYQFNGKEKNTDFGLGLYDFTARWYDDATCRFINIDPQAHLYYSMSPYAFVANNPLINTDPTGETIVTQNKDEAETIANDLNRVFENAYGVSNAFFVETKTVSVTKSNPKWGFFSRFWTGEKKTMQVEEERTVISTNQDFDWNTDEYTAAMFDVANTSSNIVVDIVGNNSTEASRAVGGILGSGLLESYGGGFTVNSQKVVLSDKLSETQTGDSRGSNQYNWTVGGVAMHELTYHIHSLGATEGGDPNKMRRNFGQKIGSRHGAGSRQNSRMRAEKAKLDKLRRKTGG